MNFPVRDQWVGGGRLFVLGSSEAFWNRKHICLTRHFVQTSCRTLNLKWSSFDEVKYLEVSAVTLLMFPSQLFIFIFFSQLLFSEWQKKLFYKEEINHGTLKSSRKS